MNITASPQIRFGADIKIGEDLEKGLRWYGGNYRTDSFINELEKDLPKIEKIDKNLITLDAIKRGGSNHPKDIIGVKASVHKAGSPYVASSYASVTTPNGIIPATPFGNSIPANSLSTPDVDNMINAFELFCERMNIYSDKSDKDKKVDINFDQVFEPLRDRAVFKKLCAHSINALKALLNKTAQKEQ